MKNNKILLTGGAGFVGSHCIISLIENGYDPIVIDNFSNSSKLVFKNIKKITNTDIKYYNFNLINKKKLNQVFKSHNFKAVIHCAGLKSVEESSKNPLLYFNNNILSSISLFESMIQNKVFKIIFSSSCTVYNDSERIPWLENSKIGKTKNPYGTSKYIIERILMDLSKSDARWKIGIARYFNPISNHASGLVGEKPSGIPSNLFPYIVKVIKQEFPYLNIYGDNYKTKDGTAIRDYFHVMDLAEGHVKFLKFLDTSKKIEVINFGSGKGYSVKDILKFFRKYGNMNIPYVIKDRRKGDIAISFAKIKKAKKLLNWRPKRNLNTMIADLCKFIYY
jgi:UDP-glucose 4-epimerase